MVENKKIFGYTKEEIHRQLSFKDYDVDPEYKRQPIHTGKMLEPCLRGSQKISENPKLFARVRRGLRGT